MFSPLEYIAVVDWGRLTDIILAEFDCDFGICFFDMVLV